MELHNCSFKPIARSGCFLTSPKRIPWNKGKLTGAKPPLQPKHVWSIRTKLQMADRKRDLALFNLAIDSKLRGCEVTEQTRQAVHEYLRVAHRKRACGEDDALLIRPC